MSTLASSDDTSREIWVGSHHAGGDAWLTVTREWPKCLLYVPCLTLVSRGENDSFLNPETLKLDVRPQYNIISYLHVGALAVRKE